MREFLPTLTSRKNSGEASASDGVAKVGGGDGDDGDGDQPDKERGQDQEKEEEEGRAGGQSKAADDGEEADVTAEIDASKPGGGNSVDSAEAATVAVSADEGERPKGSGSSPDAYRDVGDGTSAAAPAPVAAGGRAWQERGAADGLPFRYVVTDVAQVGRVGWTRH